MAHEETSSTLTLSDGRTLGYQVLSAPSLAASAPTVLYFHGFPGSQPEGGLIRPQVLQAKVRLITLSRPGYGDSTFQPRRTFLDWPKDVIEFVDHIKVEQFYIIGLSGGSPYVVACLKSIPRERLIRAAIVSGAYPSGMTSKGTLATNRMLAWASTTKWVSGMLPSIIDWYAGRVARDKARAAYFEKWFMQEVGTRNPKEAQCLEDADVRKAAIDSCTHSFKQGSHGMAWEANMLSSDWNILYEDIDGTRVDVWYGQLDKNVSVAEAVAWTASLKGCRLHVLDGESHLSLLVNHAGDILTHLLAKPR